VKIAPYFAKVTPYLAKVSTEFAKETPTLFFEFVDRDKKTKGDEISSITLSVF
jgi:hypothetical protein